MQTTVLVNIAVLLVLTLFFVHEEWQYRRFLRRMKATKTDLTAIVHQLRFPLSELQKYNDFLARKEFGNLTLSQLEAISRAEQSVDTALLLLGRFMTRSRLDRTEVMIEPALYDLSALLTSVLRASEPAAIDRRHTLSFLKPRRHIQIFIDPIVFHGIVGELVMNAIHNTPERGTITVALEEKKGKAVITVKDNGIGIDPEDRKRIFQKFFRTERSRALYTGQGLGLAFVRQCAVELGGSVTFTSTLGRGSTFSLTLPKNLSKRKSLQ